MQSDNYVDQKTVSEDIVLAIVRDLNSRQGFDFDRIDPIVFKGELIPELCKVVIEVLNKHYIK